MKCTYSGRFYCLNDVEYRTRKYTNIAWKVVEKMTTLQRLGWQWLLFVLALVGAGVAIYLTAVHYAQAPLLCSSQGVVNCERVTSSAYSVVPGTALPITIPGLAWFFVSALLAFLGTRRNGRWILRAELAWAILGMITVLYLIYVEIVLLRTLCAWCTVVHVLIFLSLLVTIVEFYRAAQADELETEDEEVPAQHLT
jgi:uncharacterized membrane protein